MIPAELNLPVCFGMAEKRPSHRRMPVSRFFYINGFMDILNSGFAGMHGI